MTAKTPKLREHIQPEVKSLLALLFLWWQQDIPPVAGIPRHLKGSILRLLNFTMSTQYINFTLQLENKVFFPKNISVVFIWACFSFVLDKFPAFYLKWHCPHSLIDLALFKAMNNCPCLSLHSVDFSLGSMDWMSPADTGFSSTLGSLSSYSCLVRKPLVGRLDTVE